MLDGTYDLIISTPVGEKRATAILATEGGVLSADVKIAGILRQKGTGTFDGNSFSAQGSVKIPLKGERTYRIEGTVEGDVLDASCKTGRHTLVITGLRR